MSGKNVYLSNACMVGAGACLSGLCSLLLMVATVAWASPTVLELDSQVEQLFAAGRYAEAETAARERLALKKEELGADHPEVAMSKHDVAVLLRIRGEYEEARALLEQSLGTLRAELGDEHHWVAANMNSLATLLLDIGDLDVARTLYGQSLGIRRTLGDAPQLATSLNNYAGLLKTLGEYDAARAMYEESLALLQSLEVRNASNEAATVSNLAAVMHLQGDLAAARPLLEQGLEMTRIDVGEDHPRYAASLNDVATFYADQGDYEAARPLYEQGLAIARTVYGEDHPNVATRMSNLALLLKKQGDYVAARALYERSIEIRRTKLGDGSPETGTYIGNLGALMVAQGDYDAAKPMFERALAIHRDTLGDQHPRVAGTLNHLANVLMEQGELEAALPLYEEALAIRRAALGDDHADTASSMNNLAILLQLQGDLEAAQLLFEQAVEILQAAFGDRHPTVATAMHSLAILHQAKGEYDLALPLAEQSLEIRRETLGEGHPAVARALDRLAAMLEAQNQPERARILRAEALTLVEARLTQLDALSEREALAWLPRIRTTLDGWLTAFPEEDTEAWAHALRFKGAIGDRLRAARISTHGDSKAADIAADLGRVRRDLARLALSSDLHNRSERLDALSKDRDRLERELLQRSASHRDARQVAEAGPAELCAALPPGAALVDILRYRRGEMPHYVAFAVMAGDCEVHRIELGVSETLDEAVAEWRNAIHHPDALASRADARGARVAELFWTPLEPVLGGTKHLFVVPDGALASAPLIALPVGEGRYFLEDRATTWLDRAHDLLLPRSEPGRGALVVGDVDYDASLTTGTEEIERGSLAPCNDGDFGPLPGAAIESNALSDRWRRRRRGEPLTRLLGSGATETAVADALRGREVVHFATHGFFATGRCRSALQGTGSVGFDPMVLSGLVLAGANVAADPLAPEDGILTAAEVATLDLTGTGLVVLSACETGLGEIRSGEGVLGLRRAFSVAGVRTLVMTLWSVSDAQTVSLMDEMYSLYLHKRRPVGAAEALRTAQLSALEAQRAHGEVRLDTWAGFIAAGAIDPLRYRRRP